MNEKNYETNFGAHFRESFAPKKFGEGFFKNIFKNN